VATKYVEVVIGISGIPGLTLHLFPRGSETQANGTGDTLTEQSQRTGCYRATVTEALAGMHEVYVRDAGGVIVFVGIVTMGNVPDAVYTVAEYTQLDPQEVAQGVWTYGSRTLTAPAATPDTDLGAGHLHRYRAANWVISLNGLGDLSGRLELLFTVKASRSLPDTRAAVQISESLGLERIAQQAAANAVLGMLTVTDVALGNVTITLHAEATAMLSSGDYFYDIKIITASGADLLVNPASVLTIDDAVTRSTE
jgi:hypothetical protein